MACLSVLVYSLVMKYAVILIILILLVRIDFFLGLFDKVNKKFDANPTELDGSDVRMNRELVPVNLDRSLKRTDRDQFMALLEAFHDSPSAGLAESALQVLKNNPAMFSDKIDPGLESQIFRWRDLLNNNRPEMVNFILELMKVLRGENSEMLKRFFALWMDINMSHFIVAYSRTPDTNCTIAPLFGDPVAEEEKLNEYYDRQESLNNFIKKENLDVVQKSLATNCLLQLEIQIGKIAPIAEVLPSSSTDSVESTNEAGP